MNPLESSSKVDEINRLHEFVQKRTSESRACLTSAVEAAWHAGKLLIEEKQRVRKSMGLGAWGTWLKRYFRGHARTARRYMLLAQTEADASSLRGMSLRQVYYRLGVAKEPKNFANRVKIEPLPGHVRFTQRLIVALKPCAGFRKITPEQCDNYRRDLRPLYELLRPLFASEAGLALVPDSRKNAS